jgi:hypothetical protein
MPSRTSVSKKKLKAKASKRHESVILRIPPTLPERRRLNKEQSASKPSSKRDGVRLVRVWGFDEEEFKDLPRKRIRRIRNPWEPTDIIILIKFLCTYGASKAFVELVKAWMDYRKAKKLEVKVGDNELKIEGTISDRVLEKRINRFRELIEGATYDDIEVTLPKGISRKMPPKQSSKKKAD